ncbi:MAG TPA: phosphatase PAP2 family protein [Candidatus Dormibacteraeota bacterium]|nr:phosphatase PAP2 family protein [Candidatus Dormibacteraeota bacterium]
MSERAYSAGLARSTGGSSGTSVDVVPRLWGILAIVGLAGFAVVTWLVAARIDLPFDAPLRAFALQWTSWSTVWALISEAANIPLVVIGVAVVAWLLWKRRWREAVLVIVTLALVTAGSEAVKQLVARPRPPGSTTVVPGIIYSYPSGHELESVTILGIVALLVWRSRRPRAARLGVAIAVAVFCAAVAVARVAIDAHYPSDVLAGLLGGVGVLALFALLSRLSSEGSGGHGTDPRGRPPNRETHGKPVHDA